jgi:hypothetical protein
LRSRSELTFNLYVQLRNNRLSRSRILNTKHLGRQTPKADFISRYSYRSNRKLALIFGRSVGTSLSERKEGRKKKIAIKKPPFLRCVN